MKNLAVIAALAAGANALVPRGSTCCFGLTASGPASGTVGQLSDGQNRLGGGLAPAQFCIDSAGGITDGNGRGCILTGPTTQFQCDQGATAQDGFSISSDGTVEYDGSPHFIACETGDNGELNIYTTNSSAVTGCKEITLTASSCKSGGSSAASSAPATSTSPQSSSVVPVSSVTVQVSSVAPESTTASVPAAGSGSGSCSSPSVESTAPGASQSAPAAESSAPAASHSSAPAASQSAPAGSASASAPASESSAPAASKSAPPATATSTTSQPTSSGGCGTTLSANYEFPHLIIPIDSSAPSKAEGTSYNGTITSTISSIFNFDVPSSDSGKQCSLVFLFPKKEDLETSSFSFSGDGKLDFSLLSSVATKSTDYSNAPAVKTDLGTFTVAPGNSYTISTFACPAGQAVSYKISNAGTTNLNYFQDYNPSPIGLYITVC